MGVPEIPCLGARGRTQSDQPYLVSVAASVRTGRPEPSWRRPRSAAEPGHGAISTGCPRARGPCVAQASVGRRWKSRRPVTMAPPRTGRRSGPRAPDALGASKAAAHAIFDPRRAAPSRSTSSPRGRWGSALGCAPPGAPCCSGSRSRWSCRPPGGSAGRTRRTAPPAPRRCASSSRRRWNLVCLSVTQSSTVSTEVAARERTPRTDPARLQDDVRVDEYGAIVSLPLHRSTGYATPCAANRSAKSSTVRFDQPPNRSSAPAGIHCAASHPGGHRSMLDFGNEMPSVSPRPLRAPATLGRCGRFPR